MTPTIRYPTNPVTPMGAYQILRDRVPQVSLLSYDGSVVFHLMGGLSVADRTTPERVELKGLKGLIPPWTTIDQKGATQDGVTFVDALYDPIEVDLEVKAHGKNPRNTRKVVNHLIAALDVKRESQLAWFTHEAGYWWAPVRWFKTPASDFDGVATNGQRIALRLRADKAFWQSYPNVAEFRFSYTTAEDDFNYNQDPLGAPDWTVDYTGTGTGNAYAEYPAGPISFLRIGQVKNDMEGSLIGDDNRTMVARRTGFTTTTDNQVVELKLGSLGEWIFPNFGGFDIWCRMSNTGTPGLNGIRFRFGRHYIRVSSFNSGVETVLRQRPTIVPPLPGERFTIVAGTEASAGGPFGIIIPPGGERTFKVMRGGATIMNFKESGTASQMGSTFRSVGFGLFTDTIINPPFIQKFSAGDNSTVSQSGFLQRINAGDQPFWDTYTCFGPGLFKFGNGPGSTDMVQFGPLLPNQIMQIRTDPRKRGVVDLTSIPPSPQELNFFQEALQAFISFATGNNVPPLLQEIQSIFGIHPPQGNPYALMSGRFSNPIPPKPAGNPAVPHYVKVSIDDGNADSKIIAAATPLRRNPY